jgi:hypothetical protein
MGQSRLTGKTRKKIAVFEIDERSSLKIYPYLTPTFLVCTNLFRDSIGRNAHPEFISDLINQSVPSGTTLILNADDLIGSRLSPANPRILFSLNRLPSDTEECHNIIKDMQICPNCQTKLQYRYVRYHHIGKAYCPNCGFASQPGGYVADADLKAHTLTVTRQGKSETFPLIQDSVFNIYNQLTAITLLDVLREKAGLALSPEAVREGFRHLHIMESRYSEERRNGVTVITNLAKGHNSIACSCVFSYVKQEPGTKTVMLMLESVRERKFTSENMTWIYDTDFEMLCDDKIVRIIVSGVHAMDYKLRLLIAGVPEEKIFYTTDELAMPQYLDPAAADSIFILHDIRSTGMAMQVKKTVLGMLEQMPARPQTEAAS